ncbi:Zinc transporter ZupT [Geosmithia morbida]|uniref:Zinc transporter ZupT n=1 Tax=Geosmithia morbida TaxID=1094350 RepID=A0A9P5D3J3_9HYPO|nr:Zinc transporter ZupT [Geosmithia morbida]KAF4125012.1 Zinc transporter ZupT [Geosmithia morbida]
MDAISHLARVRYAQLTRRRLSTAASSDEASWTNIPTNLLLAEIRRRQDGGDQTEEKPACGTRDRGQYNTAAHVFALFLILFLSTLSCGLPLLSRRTMGGQRQRIVIFYCQHVGTGVLLATAFVHLLPTAFESLTDACLPSFFNKGYRPLPGFIAMVSAIVVVGVESYLTARGAGHSHSHAHGIWDEDDSDKSTTQIPLQETTGFSRRRRTEEHRPTHLSLQDAEATEGLVAGVSPLPESTPTTGRKAAKEAEENDDSEDDDSDLDFDTSELHRPVAGEDGDDRPLSAGAVPGTPGTPGTPGIVTPEEHKKQVLQCILLEAGILFHSIFIGMAVSVATGPAFVVFLVAISFHQSFEGLALGSRIAAIQFPKSSLRPWLMVLAYGTTTPIGQAIGLIVHGLYDPQSMGGLLVVGFMNAVSSGLLLYAGLVQLLAQDFLSDSSYKTLKGRKRSRAFVAVAGGAFLMALVGAFA